MRRLGIGKYCVVDGGGGVWCRGCWADGDCRYHGWVMYHLRGLPMRADLAAVSVFLRMM